MENIEELKSDLELFRTNLSKVKKICTKIYKTEILSKKTKLKLNQDLKNFQKQKVYKEESIILQKKNKDLQKIIDNLLINKYKRNQKICLYEFICDMKLVGKKEKNFFELRDSKGKVKLEIEDREEGVFFGKGKFLNKNRNVKNDHIIPLYRNLCKFSDN